MIILTIALLSAEKEAKRSYFNVKVGDNNIGV